MTNQVATMPATAAQFESYDPKLSNADRGRAVEIQLATGSGKVIWKTGEIVQSLANGQLFEVFKDESPREPFTAEREQLRDPQPPYHVVTVGCPACHAAAEARRVDNTYQDIGGVTYKYNCSGCGKFIAGEPTEPAPEQEKPQTVHIFDQETNGAWASLLSSMDGGNVVEIDGEVFYYFLEVLPPAFMGRRIKVGGVHRFVQFGFAEGAENVTAFWQVRDRMPPEVGPDEFRFFCQRTDIFNPNAY